MTPPDVVDLFSGESDRPYPFLLESALPGPPYGRLSFFGSDPYLVFTSKGRNNSLLRGGELQRAESDPFETLRALLDTADPAHLVVGYLGYDLAQHIERLPHRAVDDQRFPDLHLAFYDQYTRVDHDSGSVERIDVRGTRPRAGSGGTEPGRTAPRSTGSNFSKKDYLRAVRRAKEYIGAGDIYQVNLSQRFSAPAPARPLELYRRLRSASPAPYAAFLSLGDRAILSSSPEEFLHVEGGRIRTRPIKGTRPRGENPATDSALAEELRRSPKDDAELAMIVDLERNDLGRVCEYGSVQVTAPKDLETHPTVHHLSATVEGILRPDVDTVDILRATFPGGSITGAPKIRAMEIIDELEPTRRSVYTGAIGYFFPDGRLHLNIAIRTILLDGDQATFQVGGAIVWDSDPEAEYQETLVKARGMAKALGLKLENA